MWGWINPKVNGEVSWDLFSKARESRNNCIFSILFSKMWNKYLSSFKGVT